MNGSKAKLHHFLFHYKAVLTNKQGFNEGSSVVSIPKINIKARDLIDFEDEIKKKGEYETVIVISVSYLGLLTEDEFNDE